MRQAAQNQHYVPKFILRNFMSDPENERVQVFAKSGGRGFTTSIKNVMAERRFHEFAFDEEYRVSFEGLIGGFEERLLPRYRKLLTSRKLDRTDEERGELGVLVAFQFLRTRKTRDFFVDMDKTLIDKAERMGFRADQIDGYEPLTPDTLKVQHLRFIRNVVPELANLTAMKDILLFEAPPGRSFYLGDNPVCLHTSVPSKGFYSGIGFGVRGVEIYMPLSADLMLGAWCPSVLQGIRDVVKEGEDIVAGHALGLLAKGQVGPDAVRKALAEFRAIGTPAQLLLASVLYGRPEKASAQNMDFFNSLQVSAAREFIICPRGDFDLAKRFMKDHPHTRGSGFHVG